MIDKLFKGMKIIIKFDNMKSVYFLSVFSALLIFFSGCRVESGEGDIISEFREVKDFTKINLTTAADVEIFKGVNLTVEVSDYENILKHIIVETENDKLIIKTKPNNLVMRNSKAKVIITLPDDLTDIELSGSGKINVIDSFSKIRYIFISGSGSVGLPSAYFSSDLNVKISGSGSVTIEDSEFKDNVYAEISGSGNIEVSGTAREVHTKIPGSGHILFGDLLVKNATSAISGSGNTTVYPLNQLNASISGSGNIYYYGNPNVIATVTGSGRVVKK